MKIEKVDLTLSDKYVIAQNKFQILLGEIVYKQKRKISKTIEAKLFLKNDESVKEILRLDKNPHTTLHYFIKKNFELTGREAYKVLFSCGIFEKFLKSFFISLVALIISIIALNIFKLPIFVLTTVVLSIALMLLFVVIALSYILE